MNLTSTNWTRFSVFLEKKPNLVLFCMMARTQASNKRCEVFLKRC